MCSSIVSRETKIGVVDVWWFSSVLDVDVDVDVGVGVGVHVVDCYCCLS
jgi:hypothetical protein